MNCVRVLLQPKVKKKQKRRLATANRSRISIRVTKFFWPRQRRSTV